MPVFTLFLRNSMEFHNMNLTNPQNESIYEVMMMKQKSEKPPKKSLLVTIEFSIKKDYSSYILSCCIEHFGTHLENKMISKTIREMTILFENLKDGEAFYSIFEQTKLKVSKQEC